MTTTAPHKLQAIADALKVAFEGIVGVTVYEYEPVGELALPAITIGMPTLGRTELDEPETRLGTDDWSVSWAVTLQIAMHEPHDDQLRARRLIGEMVEAIDLDHTLGGQAREARLTEARGGYSDPDRPPRLIVVECDVQVLALMPRL